MPTTARGSRWSWLATTCRTRSTSSARWRLISAQFVQAQCSDLTPYLAGDAAKDYPNLAAIPGYAYKGAGGVFDNRLYGIPIHRYLPAFWFFRNTDIWDAEIGADVVPKDAADFKKILQQLNRPQKPLGHRQRQRLARTDPRGEPARDEH